MKNVKYSSLAAQLHSNIFCTTAFPCILQYHLLLYIIVIGGNHSIPSSMETRSPCSFPDMISRNSRIDREDLANTMSDRMHGIILLFTASQLKRPPMIIIMIMLMIMIVTSSNRRTRYPFPARRAGSSPGSTSTCWARSQRRMWQNISLTNNHITILANPAREVRRFVGEPSLVALDPMSLLV